MSSNHPTPLTPPTPPRAPSGAALPVPTAKRQSCHHTQTAISQLQSLCRKFPGYRKPERLDPLIERYGNPHRWQCCEGEFEAVWFATEPERAAA